MKLVIPGLLTSILLCSTLVLGTVEIQLDINKTLIQSNRQWSRVQLGFSGGNEPYQLYYDQYPDGWSQVINYVYIPAGHRQINRKYPCKVRAVDKTGTTINGTIIFSISSQKVYVSNTLLAYDQVFDDSFYESGVFEGKPTLVKKNGTATTITYANSSEFKAQTDEINKISSISEESGAGIVNILSALTNSSNKDSVTLAKVEASVQLKDELTGTNTTPPPAPATKPITNIQSAAASVPQSNTLNTLSADQKQLVLINNIKANQISGNSQQRSIESIFSRLPGSQELDTIILTGDSYALVKTIQKVIQSDLSCEQKISYLSDFFGRIQSAISLKAFTATQLAIIVEGAQAEINRISQEIDKDRQFITKLGIGELRNKLNTVLVQLQDAYSKFNEVDSQIAPKQAVIKALNNDIEAQKSKADSLRQQIPIQQLQLNQITDTIAKLQDQYKDALNKRSLNEANIKKITEYVSGYDIKIKQDLDNIDIIQTEISKRGDNIDKLKNNYQTLEVSIERQRTEIAGREKTKAELTALIANLQQRADLEKKKMNITEAGRIRDLVKNMQSIVPNITKQADDVNYKCYQLKQVEVINQNNYITYTVPTTSYTSYIQSSYQIKPDTNNIKSGSNKLSITPVCILDNNWNANYGNPYTPTSFIQAKEFTFKEDFNCLGPSYLQSGSGVIRTVNKKFIQIDNAGKIQKLNLGACSRVQSPTPVAKVGQKIYFRAQKVDKNQFNLYKGSCI